MSTSITKILLITPLLLFVFFLAPKVVQAAPPPAIDCGRDADAGGRGPCADAGGGGGAAAAATDEYWCGNLRNSDNSFNEEENYQTKFNFGCLGKKGPAGLGPIQDLLFALIRFASIGVGIAITVSMIVAGIQYSTAEGNPEASQKAKLRAQNALIGLAIYIFAFSALQFLIPGGIFN